MTVSLCAAAAAAAAALTLGLPIVALGEYLRERRERRPSSRHTPPTREDIP